MNQAQFYEWLSLSKQLPVLKAAYKEQIDNELNKSEH